VGAEQHSLPSAPQPLAQHALQITQRPQHCTREQRVCVRAPADFTADIFLAGKSLATKATERVEAADRTA
jgi:hypothetical protein